MGFITSSVAMTWKKSSTLGYGLLEMGGVEDPLMTFIINNN